MTEELRRVLAPVHDLASVYLSAPPPAEIRPAAHVERRWRALAGELRARGADEPTLEAVDAAVRTAADPRAGIAIFAHSGRVEYTQPLDRWTGPDRATFGAPAHLVPLLEWQQAQTPYVLVVTDRTGADISGPPLAPIEVTGPDDEIERNAPGGWSQPRYQRRAEDSWEHNAAAVAAETARFARAVGARLVIVTGDVRAVQLLDKELAEHHELVVEHLTGGRRPDGSEGDRETHVASVVREQLARESAALLAKFADLRGPAGLAVEGASDTLAALAEGRVATLIVAPGTPEHPSAWFGPPPTAVALDLAGIVERHQGVRSGPLVDVAIRAALLTGAGVHVIAPDTPGQPHHGIGALCRFPVSR